MFTMFLNHVTCESMHVNVYVIHSVDVHVMYELFTATRKVTMCPQLLSIQTCIDSN